MESKTMTLEEQFKEEKKIEAYEDNRMQPKVYSEIYVEWLEEQLTLTDDSNSFKITDAAKEKLDFILGHSITRNFPKTQPTKEWAGAVLDFLEITGFLK